MEKTNPENIDIIEPNQNPLYGKFQENEDKVLKIQKKYKKYQQEKNKPQFKNKIYSGWDQNEKNLIFIYADDVYNNEVQSLDVKIYSREKMNITIKKYTIEEMNENHIIKDNKLSFLEAENNGEKIANKIFLVMNGLDPSIQNFQEEEKDDDNFPIEENSEKPNNKRDNNAFPLEEDQKIGDNINESVQISNHDNNNNHYYNNYQDIITPDNNYNINQNQNNLNNDNNEKKDENEEEDGFDDFEIENINEDEI